MVHERLDGGAAAGYRKPPAASRFRKGVSGNPKGRPRGQHTEPPHEAVLGQMVTLREAGSERTVTAAEAFLLQTARKGLAGDGTAARIIMDAIAQARELRLGDEPSVDAIVFCAVRPGSVNSALQPLCMARKLDPYRETARMALEPWLVEVAMARLKRRLTREEQAIVFHATRTPAKVRWPGWWVVRK